MGPYDFEETQVLIKERGMSGQFHAKHSFTFGLERQTVRKATGYEQLKLNCSIRDRVLRLRELSLRAGIRTYQVTHRFL